MSHDYVVQARVDEDRARAAIVNDLCALEIDRAAEVLPLDDEEPIIEDGWIDLVSVSFRSVEGSSLRALLVYASNAGLRVLDTYSGAEVTRPGV